MKKGLLRSLVALLVVAIDPGDGIWMGLRRPSCHRPDRAEAAGRAPPARRSDACSATRAWSVSPRGRDELRSPGQAAGQGGRASLQPGLPSQPGLALPQHAPGGEAVQPERAWAPRPDDPVHVLRACIAVLRGQEAQGFDGLTPRHAPDLAGAPGGRHPPTPPRGKRLHTGNRRTPAPGRSSRIPSRWPELANDKGGNEGEPPPGPGARHTNLHRFWDTNLVKRIGRHPLGHCKPPWKATSSPPARRLASTACSRRSPLRRRGPRTPCTWPPLRMPAWTRSRSSATANAWMAHPGLQRYEEYATPVAAQQLYKASMRLAATLNSIWP